MVHDCCSESVLSADEVDREDWFGARIYQFGNVRDGLVGTVRHRDCCAPPAVDSMDDRLCGLDLCDCRVQLVRGVGECDSVPCADALESPVPTSELDCLRAVRNATKCLVAPDVQRVVLRQSIDLVNDSPMDSNELEEWIDFGATRPLDRPI